jgi:hypothetical protein
MRYEFHGYDHFSHEGYMIKESDDIETLYKLFDNHQTNMLNMKSYFIYDNKTGIKIYETDIKK